MELPNHGANPIRLYERAGITPPQQIVDFSENVHPFGAPAFLAERWPSLLESTGSYPDPGGEPFRTAAAEFHQVKAGQVAVSNGAAEVFTWLARRYRDQKVVLIEPAFSEYRQTLEVENVQIEAIQLNASKAWKVTTENVQSAVSGCAALYICNPHNPTGTLLDTKTIKEMAQSCLEQNCELVVDEAFIDFIGEQASVIPLLEDFPNVIIVRSMTKMYAIPGLRLGYVISGVETIRQLKQGAAHWNVNALSAAIGADCLKAHLYRQNVINAASVEREKMQRFLVEHRCQMIDSKANFLCFQLPNPADSALFFTDLLRQGIVLRHTESFSGMDGKWFRIGMKSTENMEKLREAIAKWLQAN